MSMRDVYYVVFRHKKRILACTTAGLLASAALYYFRPPPFASEAKLYVRYVLSDRKVNGPGDDEVQTKSPDQGGETIMDSEEEILTSMDLAKQVAASIGPERILGRTTPDGNDVLRAAAAIEKGLTVEVPPRSSVIKITFKHRNPEIVQPVLRELIDGYLKLHVEIHRAVGLVGDFLAEETDQLRSQLVQTEGELQRAVDKAGLLSGEDGKKAAIVEIASLRHELILAQAELAERSAILKGESRSSNNPNSASNVSLPATSELRALLYRVDLLEKREQELLGQFTPESPRVREVEAQLREAEAALQSWRDAHPEAAADNAPPLSRLNRAGSDPMNDERNEETRVSALKSRINVLSAEIDRLRTETARADDAQGTISELRRRKELEESNYKYYSASLEHSRINEALGEGKVSNISQIQTPSPPYADWGKMKKLLLGTAIGGFAVGLGWAFFMESYIDTSVRRPRDVEHALGLDLFLSIPDVSHRARLKSPPRLRNVSSNQGALAEPPEPSPISTSGVDGPSRDKIFRDEIGAELRPFHDTLADRLLTFFENIGHTHTPKLIAVTGIAAEAGVTTVASGLARALSENGEENVLLIDMTAGQGSAREFYHRREACDLDELLEAPDTARVEKRLFVAAERPVVDAAARPSPRRFSKLVPQLKASDFDYIIFDMPPVSQTSITPRLAAFMDLVLLVIESEKTDRDLVRRAANFLAHSKIHMGAILNMTRNYIPSRLQQAFVGPS